MNFRTEEDKKNVVALFEKKGYEPSEKELILALMTPALFSIFLDMEGVKEKGSFDSFILFTIGSISFFHNDILCVKCKKEIKTFDDVEVSFNAHGVSSSYHKKCAGEESK